MDINILSSFLPRPILISLIISPRQLYKFLTPLTMGSSPWQAFTPASSPQQSMSGSQQDLVTHFPPSQQVSVSQQSFPGGQQSCLVPHFPSSQQVSLSQQSVS